MSAFCCNTTRGSVHAFSTKLRSDHLRLTLVIVSGLVFEIFYALEKDIHLLKVTESIPNTSNKFLVTNLIKEFDFGLKHFAHLALIALGLHSVKTRNCSGNVLENLKNHKSTNKNSERKGFTY